MVTHACKSQDTVNWQEHYEFLATLNNMARFYPESRQSGEENRRGQNRTAA